MKRTRIEIEAIASFDNLVLAAFKAGRAKRTRPEVRGFFDHFDASIQTLREGILSDRLPYGRFKVFTIFDPKKRRIHAACFEDRVFHHAVMNFMEPVLERALVPTTYACRPNKGTLAAVYRVQESLRRYPWYVKIDIEHYFECIDHEILYQLIARRFKGGHFSTLIRRILVGCPAAPGKGLPIGSLTSQHFANYYLDGLDRLIMENLKAAAHVRYMDDVIWWTETRDQARSSLQWVNDYVEQKRLLKIKPTVQINRSSHGVSYCGYRISPGAIRLSPRKKRRYSQHRLAWEKAWIDGLISDQQLQNGYAAIYAMTAHTDSRGWRQENLCRTPSIEV